MVARHVLAALLLLGLRACVLSAQEPDTVDEDSEVAEGPKNTTLLGSCKENEQWEECTHCEHHCEGGKVCPDKDEDCHYPVCRCVEGYSRDSSGLCIPTSSCPRPRKTGDEDSEEESTTPPSTTTLLPSLSTIITIMSKIRPEKSKEKEEDEFAEHPLQRIVNQSQVKPPLKVPSPAGECAANEVITDCGECEATCTHASRKCVRDYCEEPRCQCKKGFVRNPYGSCVTPSSCNAILYRAPSKSALKPLPATVPSSCNRNCADGYMCVLGPRVYLGPSLGWQIYPICISTKFRKYYSNL